MRTEDLIPPPDQRQQAPGKIYSLGQISAAALVGSPIAGAILIASNFRAFGLPDSSKNSLLLGVASTVIIIVAGFFVPESTPNSVIPAIYCTIIYYLAKHYQGVKVDDFIEAGGQKYSHWRVFGIAVACLVAVMAIAFTVLSLNPELIPG